MLLRATTRQAPHRVAWTSAGSRLSRSRAAPTSCVCIALQWGGRSSATASTEARREQSRPACTCTHAKSWCRFTTTARRSASPRPCRRTCSICCMRADGRVHQSPNDGAASRPWRGSVQRRLQTLGRRAVVSLAAESAVGQLGQNRAVARQALAIDMARWLPQLRAHDRLGALKEDAVDGNDEHGARALAVDDEALPQIRIDRDRGAAVNADGLATARDQEQKRDPWIVQDVAQAIDAVIATPVGYKQRLLVVNADETRRVAARGAIEAVRARSGERKERRRLDKSAVMGGDAVGLLGDRWSIGLTIDALERLDGGDDVIAKFRHVRLPKTHGLYHVGKRIVSHSPMPRGVAVHRGRQR